MSDLVTMPKTKRTSDEPAATAMDMWVGRRIRAARADRGMTAGQLADQTGISRQMFQKYERAEARITAGRLAEVAAVLDVSPGWFFEGSEAMRMPTHRPELALDDLTTETADLVQRYLRLTAEQKKAARVIVEAMDVSNRAEGREGMA